MAVPRPGPGPRDRRNPRRIGFVKIRVLLPAVLVPLTTAWGAGESLSPDQKTWCLENADRVVSTASDLSLLGFIDAYYETQGDGLGPDGQPATTDRNIAVTANLRARNSANPGAVLHDLFTRYLGHPDGQIACNAASPGNA